LRPGGKLLDLHPEPEHNRIEVRTGQGVKEVGRLDDSAYIRDVLHGREVMARLIRDGLFVKEREIVFDHIAHAANVDSWLEHRAEAGSRAVLDPEVVERARALLGTHEGEILVQGRGYAVCLNRV